MMKANKRKVFFVGEKPLVKKLVLLDGFARAGKFFAGKIISNLKKMDYFQAVYALEQIPFLYRLDTITEDAAIALIRKIVDEHAYNIRIGRNLNLRYGDASSLFNSYEVDEYIRRSMNQFGEINLTADKIIDSFWKGNRYSLFVVHEVLPNMQLFFKAYPALKIIELIRHPVDVIHSWYLRGWGRRFGLDPLSFIPVINGNKGPIPWHAYEWRKEYEASCEADRVIKGVAALTEMCEQTYQSLSAKQKRQILFVRYENVVENTYAEIERICAFLNTEPSGGMPVIMAREKCPGKISLNERARKISDLKKNADKKAFELMMKLSDDYEAKENIYKIVGEKLSKKEELNR
ncbi:MAG: sulfotransferase domain-containing protein [Nitrospirae bacterium]|nr:sulfotransferase domain-containing protein [Nitrospirota bacterium]